MTLDIGDGADVVEGVGVENQQVGQFADFDRAEVLLSSEEVGAVTRGNSKGFLSQT